MIDTFKVTYKNKDIMDKLERMHKDIIVTNGKVKFHREWLYLLTIAIGTMIGWLFYFKSMT